MNAVRLLLPRCWVDQEKCEAGIEALTHYRKQFNERLQKFTATPVHDWASHAADAFRGFAVRHKAPEELPKLRLNQPLNPYLEGKARQLQLDGVHPARLRPDMSERAAELPTPVSH